MPQPKQALAPPLDSLPGPSAPGTASRLPKRSFRPSSKNTPAPNSVSDLSSSGLLVTVVGSSPVDGRPFDSEILPDFLCPRLHAHPSAQPSSSSQAPSSLYWVPCDASQAATYSGSSFPPLVVDYSARPRKKRSRRSVNIADKYEQYPDGRWRKADSWELYGSSSCAISQCMDATPTEIPVQDDQIASSAGAGSSVTSNSPSSAVPNLPHGWGGSKSNDDMTGIILGLSLSLALSLIAFMIGMVLWRRKRRKHSTDAEKPPSTIDTASTPEAQRVRSKQRMWQRASAKWLANVKHSARRRRKFGATLSTRPSDTDPFTDRTTTVQAYASAVSLTRTQTTTDHGSACTTPPASVRRTESRPPRSRSLNIASSDCNANHPSDADSLSPPLPHPPAYVPDLADNHSHSHRQLHVVAYPDPCPSELHSTVDPFAHVSSPSPYEPPIHSAHVATDDKAVLAQMARMASAPPPGDELSLSSASGGTSEVHPSVPILEVDSFEALPPELQLEASESDANDAHGLRGASNSVVTLDTLSPAKGVAPSPHPGQRVVANHDMDLEVPSYAEVALRHRGSVLPLPPAKVPLTGPTFYEYPNEFEDDVVTAEPPPGPSSPPFEEPYAPPFAFADGPNGAHMMVPSAPPLEDEDEGPHIAGVLPSAPPFDMDDRLPTLDPHLLPIPPDLESLESSTPPTGDHRNVNVDARPGAASPGQEAEYGTSTSPPQYLP